MKKRLFSGIQPSGLIHVGNYLGALQNWVKLMETHEAFFCVVDYHATTVEFDPGEFRRRTVDTAAMLLAVGLDPEKCTLFVQSQVPAHTELAWIFGTVIQIGHLERMTQFKEKSQQQAGNINVGLFTYPVLQAADIALYKAEVVPVGEDQVQHIELSREIIRRFNHRYGPVFPEPQTLVSGAPRIRGLDGKAKMSKSLNNAIALNDSPGEISAKLKTAVTDENRKRRNDPGNPDICNVYTLHKAFTPAEKVAEINVECRRAGIGCVDCKNILAGHLADRLSPIRERFQELSRHPDTVTDVLADGARRCGASASQTMAEVRHLLGLAGA